MFDQRNYQNACARLTLGSERLEEMIAMTENTKRKKTLSRPLRAALIAAACVVALAATAMAAPAVQQLFTTYTITFRNADSTTVFSLPTMTLEEREGRDILTVDGLETDVTDAFAKNGQYEVNVDGADIAVKSDGWVEITMAANGTDDPITYSFDLNARDNDNLPTSLQLDGGEALTEVGIYNIVTDETGAIEVSPAG